MELVTLRQKQSEPSRVTHLYQQEMRDLRSQVEELSRDKNRILIERNNMEDELQVKPLDCFVKYMENVRRLFLLFCHHLPYPISIYRCNARFPHRNHKCSHLSLLHLHHHVYLLIRCLLTPCPALVCQPRSQPSRASTRSFQSDAALLFLCLRKTNTSFLATLCDISFYKKLA